MLSFSQDSRVAEQQMHAIIFYLTAFGYIDADFDASEKAFIQDHIAKLVQQRARTALGEDLSEHQSSITRWTKHFHEVLDTTDQEIRALFTESVAEGEDTTQFVLAKLKLRAFEFFKRFDEEGRAALLGTVDELMQADGVVHPHEQRFRNELHALLTSPMELDDAEIEPLEQGALVIDGTASRTPKQEDHPFLRRLEWDYPSDPATFNEKAAPDLKLIDQFMAKLNEKRAAGRGKLETLASFAEVSAQPSFLDGHVFVVPPEQDKSYELLVLGDLHGCYSCLKAALLQSDFFGKVQAYHNDPEHSPNMMLVLLGDYIDRGKFSYNGVLRTVMELFMAVPDHVFPLRGNHEYYIEYQGRVLAPVRPSEAMNSLQSVAPNEVFAAYMRLFEAMPNMLVFDRTLFVHAGIPRDDTMAQKLHRLADLNDSEIRFQMLWSDPSDADFIPQELQKANARFPFGRRQFHSFMSKIGCTSMVRGHERVVEGIKTVYDGADGTLLSLFSAGGKTNEDLPEKSNYREVTPMALSIRHEGGISTVTPFAIDYARYNDPRLNSFREQLRSLSM